MYQQLTRILSGNPRMLNCNAGRSQQHKIRNQHVKHRNEIIIECKILINIQNNTFNSHSIFYYFNILSRFYCNRKANVCGVLSLIPMMNHNRCSNVATFIAIIAFLSTTIKASFDMHTVCFKETRKL